MTPETAIPMAIAFASLVFNFYQYRDKSRADKEKKRDELDLSVETKKLETASQLQIATMARDATREERFISELENDSKILRDTVRELEAQRVGDRSRIEELSETALSFRLEVKRLKNEQVELDEQLQQEAKLRGILEQRVFELAELLRINNIDY